MNDYNMIKPRRRNRTLLVVEGDNEKEQLFRTLLRSFPEIKINKDDIWIYKTNIYKLYDTIKKEYDSDFSEIDLPLLITRNKDESKAYKRDFSNIYLIFDYDCQESTFSTQKICEMQECFNDSTANGKLYINYPMVESYLEIKNFPVDDSYEDAKVQIKGKFNSKRYKQCCKGTNLFKLIEFPKDVEKKLKKGYSMNEVDKFSFVEELLQLKEDDIDKVNDIIQRYICDEELQQRAEHHILHRLHWLYEYIKPNTYWKYIRKIFQRIIYYNICKANKLLNDKYALTNDEIKDVYRALRLQELLYKQNEFYCENKCIWILNTSVFLVLDYDAELLSKDCNESADSTLSKV